MRHLLHKITVLSYVAMTVSVIGIGLTLTGCQSGGDAEMNAIAAMPQEEKEAAAQEAYEAGIAKAKSGQLDKAITDYQTVLKYFPNHVAANVGLGLAYAEKGDFETAETVFNRVLDVEPDNVDANANLAWVLAEQGEWTKALDRGLVAQRVAPDNAYLHNTLGWIYTETDQPDDAIAAYQKAVSLNPSINAAWLALVSQHCQQGNVEAAQEALTHLPVGSQEISDGGKILSDGCPADA